MAEKKSLHEKFKGFEEELQKRDDKITNFETMLKKNCANHNQD